MTRPSERTILLLLASVQFAHIVDFMIMMPLGPQLMRELDLTPRAFSALVAAYTIAAGVVGFASAPFLDRFDRRKALLVTFAGFASATLLCGLVHSGGALFVARAICGAFGGVSGALVMTIVGDVVPPERRAAGMGIIMTAFSAAAALGVPFGLVLAHRFRWEAPFLFLAGLSALTWIALALWLPPARSHLEQAHSLGGGFVAFRKLLKNANAGRGLLFLSALVFGHFLIIPLMPEHLVRNVGVPESQLWMFYLTGGVLSAITGPWIGRFADRYGRVRVLTILVCVAAVVTLAMTFSGPRPLWVVLAVGGAFFVFASGRFVPGSAIMSLAVPPGQRGAYMSLNACVRDLTSGVTSSLGGWLVTQSADGRLVGYERLGLLAVAGGALSLWLARQVHPAESDSRIR